MSAYYDLYQTPNPSSENRDDVRLHARILPRGTISADKFRELVPPYLTELCRLLRTSCTVGCPRVGLWKWESWAIFPFR